MNAERSLCGLFLGLALFVGVPQGPSLAAAAGAEQVPSCQAEVIVLHASNAGGGIDPKVGDLPQLKRPPFSAYDTYKLLDRSKLSLVKAAPSTFKLPGGRELIVTMKDEVPAKAGSPRKVLLSASIRNAAGEKTLPMLDVTAAPGEIFFVAGPKHEGGTLVMGIRVAS